MIVLMIFDGWGLSDRKEGNAIFQARTPNMDRWMREYPGTRLKACCEHVGLPSGQMGNSEVGHLNIGAGRVVHSPLMRLNIAIRHGEFQKNEALLNALGKAKEKGRPMHLLGLVSDGGVHSHVDHLFALIDMARENGNRIAVHALLDGRDTEPKVAEKYLVDLEARLLECQCGRIADIAGRYYTMDRDKRWDRTKKGYDALVSGEGLKAATAREALRMAYERGEGDEFVKPTIICPGPEYTVHREDNGMEHGRENREEYRKENGEGHGKEDEEYLIRNGDEVIFFNFRPDRARQISHALTDKEFTGFGRENVLVNLTCMMKYEESLDATVAFPTRHLENVLGEVLSDHGMRQLRITETEKFTHVTFFLNGGREEPFPGEDRMLIPSPRVATYDLQPEMSAPVIVDRLLPVLDNYDVVLMNFANCDMVGHTGIMEAAIKAVETVDSCAGKVVEEVLERKGTVLITADHGNAEATQDEHGSPLTAHTLNPVPFIWISEDARRFPGNLREGSISCIAPTLLKLLGLPVPSEMTSPCIIPDEYVNTKSSH